MASGMEMMIQSAIKAAGFDPKQVQADINSFRDTVMSYIASDQEWKKQQAEKTDLILVRIQSLLDYSIRDADALHLITEKVSYSRDPFSIEPESDAAKFAALPNGHHTDPIDAGLDLVAK